MASPMPRGTPRPHGFNQKNPPPPDYNLDALADNVQNLNINRPISTPNSGPRTAPPFGQSLPFPPTAPAPFASPSMSRPGSPPGALARLSMPSSAPTPPTLPSNVSPGRSITPAVSVPILAPGSRPPPPGSLPSSLGGHVVPPPEAPSGGFPFSGLPGGPTVAPPPGPRPFTSSASLPLAAAGPSVAPPNSCASDPMNNGQPLASGTFTSRPTFPAPGSTTMSVMGLPPTRAVVRAPSQAPSTLAFPGSSAVDAPLAPPMQSPSPFADGSLDVSTSLDPPPATQIWMEQPHQVALPLQMPGSVQPPRMFGTTPSLPSQPMTTISPAMGQSGSFVAAPSKIDPDHIPRPTQSSTMTVHETLQGSQANPSLAVASDYVVRDTGNCSPWYMRCTINRIPCTVDLLNTSGMQLALLVQPLALPHPSEEPIQVVDFGESGPVRCSRCKGYVNPFMKFIDQGRRFICNLCGNTEVTPHDYHCNLAPDGRHRDADERPELCRGTVEFVASTEYMEGPRTMVGIATFDSTIHFYNLKRALQQPLMLIVPDVEDVYTPLQSDVIVQLSECRQHLELLLENIPSMFQNNKTSDSAFGAAVQASFLAMKSNGGKLLVFQSVLPSLGIGSLSSREAEGRINISAGEKENHKLLQPADSTLKTMAMDFAEYQVCIDVFITTQTFVDITSISVISRTTGGQVYYYFPFSALADPSKLYNDLRWNVTRPQGFEAVMRVRCSQGIQVQEYSGNFCKRIPTDIDLPGIDSDKTIMVTLKHGDKLQDGSECAFQCALLYTTLYGQRRIRVMTLSLPCTNMLSNLFHAADLDTQFTCFLKQVACRIPSIPLAIVREHVLDQCVSILFSYRKFCATASSSGQLILPEALKLLPLYTLALMKSAGMRTDGRIDDQSFWINYVSFLSPSLAIPLVYPRMMAIHDLPKGKEEPLVPNSMPLSSEQLSDEGIYFLENGEDALIYVGDLVDSDIMEQLFGISSLDGISTQFVLQLFENPLSKNLNDVVNEIRHQRCSYLRIKLCKKGDPSGMLFLSYMVEDRNAGSSSYIEFLVQVHQQILIKMS